MAVDTFQLKKRILNLGCAWIADVLDGLHVKYKAKVRTC